MPIIKRIVCLANSRKLGDRCIAGKEVLESRVLGWIRPVSTLENEAIPKKDLVYLGGGTPSVLDIMEIPLIKAVPKDYQTENWIFDLGHNLRKVDQFTWGNLKQLEDPSNMLWINGHSTSKGQNDHVPNQHTGELKDSLRFIRVEQLNLLVNMETGYRGRPQKRVQGRFVYHNTEYCLRVTDPVYEKMYLDYPEGAYKIGQCYVTVSLGAPYHGAAYKLIAGIFERDKYR